MQNTGIFSATQAHFLKPLSYKFTGNFIRTFLSKISDCCNFLSVESWLCLKKTNKTINLLSTFCQNLIGVSTFYFALTPQRSSSQRQNGVSFFNFRFASEEKQLRRLRRIKFGDEDPKYLIALLHLEFASVAWKRNGCRLESFAGVRVTSCLIGCHSGQMTNCLARGVIPFNMRLHLAPIN